MQRLAGDAVMRDAVREIAEHGPSARGQMHANLMRPARHQLTPDQRPSASRAEHLVVGPAFLAARIDDDAAAIGRASCERKGNRAASRVWFPLNDREILLGHEVSREVALQLRVDVGGQRNEHQTRCVFVEPGDNPWLHGCRRITEVP